MKKPADKPVRGGTVAVGDILPQIIRQISSKAGGFLPVILCKWEEIVGTAVANHTKPSSLKGKNLYIEVDDSVWMAELSRFHKRRIIDSINHNFEGKIIEEVIFIPKRKS